MATISPVLYETAGRGVSRHPFIVYPLPIGSRDFHRIFTCRVGRPVTILRLVSYGSGARSRTNVHTGLSYPRPPPTVFHRFRVIANASERTGIETNTREITNPFDVFT